MIKNGKGGKVAIIRYGPRNAPVFQRESIEEEDDIKDISNPKTRIGERFDYVNRKRR